MQCWVDDSDSHGTNPRCTLGAKEKEHKKRVLQLEKWLNKKNIKIKRLNAALNEKKQTIKELKLMVFNLTARHYHRRRPRSSNLKTESTSSEEDTGHVDFKIYEDY